MLTRRGLLRATLATGGALAAPSILRAQSDYPSGPVRAICMFPPGTGADVKVRFYANALGKATGKTVIVENRPGALGNIATEYVARSKPDGATIYIAPGSSMLAAAPYLFKKLSYDPINDFEHITTLNFSAFALCVAGDSPFKSVADLTAHLKDKGEGAFYGAIAPPSVVCSEIYKRQMGLKTVGVNYKDQGALMNDLISGQLSFIYIDVITVAAYIRQGRARALAMACANRMSVNPDTPGALEVGIKDMDIRNWWSVHVPAKTPKPICDKLETLFNDIVKTPEHMEFLKANGSDPMPGNARMVRELLVQETKNWAEYARIARIEPI